MSRGAKARIGGSLIMLGSLVGSLGVVAGAREAAVLFVGMAIGGLWGWAVALEWAASLSDAERRL